MQSRKLLTMLGSLLAAVILWLYVVTSVAPEATTRVSSIPINIDGSIVLEERNLIITDQDVSTLAIELSTSRVNLSKLNAETIRVNADASKIREPGEYTLTCTVTFPDTVRSSDIDILRKSVDAVTVTVTRLKQRAIPIELNWTGSVREGFLLEADNALMEPAEVVVYGPEAEVDNIERVVVNYDVSDLEETLIETLPIHFLDAEDQEMEFSELTTYNISQTSLTLPVYRTRQLTLGLELIEGGGVTAENASYTAEPATIQVKGAADVVDLLPDPFLVGTVDLSAIADREELTFPLNLPAGVTNIGGETEVAVEIRVTGVSTDSISVSDIRLTNEPEGYTTEVQTRTVHVTVRGSTQEIREIKQSIDNGIYILVDLEYYTQPGAYTVTGRVVNPSHPAISVAEQAEIGIIITQTPETSEPEEE